jgi:Cu-Zn family superoxide dismutase
MTHRLRLSGVAGASVLASALVLASAGHPDLDQTHGATATAELRNPQGRGVGQVELRDAEAGILLHVRLTGVPPGAHALHLHETGRCDPPSFESAGGHFNPTGARHGFLSAGGPHAGDLPNVHVPESGRIEVELLAADASLADNEPALLDADGAAVLVHERADDHRSEPAGDAGSRIACGVVSR